MTGCKSIKSKERVGLMKKKQHTITFRATEEEYKMLKDKAKGLNLTVTGFIVKCCRESEAKNKLKK